MRIKKTTAYFLILHRDTQDTIGLKKHIHIRNVEPSHILFSFRRAVNQQ